MAKSNSEYQAAFKKRQKDSGLLRREYYATDGQHKKMKACLDRLVKKEAKK